MTRQSIAHVPVEQLTAHPANIREGLGDLTEMALSIKEHGILQPLTATEDLEHDGKLLLLAGHRRLGGALKAGLMTVPVVIRHDVTDQTDHLVLMLVENTQRRDLNPIERAEAYGALRNKGLSIVEIARRIGTSASTVSYYLNLLMLDEFEREEIRSGMRGSGEAIAEVRERRQEAREAAGMPLRGRPKSGGAGHGAWFNPAHRLASTVAKLCDHPDQPKVGQTGCGPCWEKAIVADAAGIELPMPERNRAHRAPAPFDPAVVERRLTGDHEVHASKADRQEIIRRCHARGMSDGQIADLAGFSSKTVLRLRKELGLPAAVDAGGNPVTHKEAS